MNIEQPMNSSILMTIDTCRVSEEFGRKFFAVVRKMSESFHIVGHNTHTRIDIGRMWTTVKKLEKHFVKDFGPL